MNRHKKRITLALAAVTVLALLIGSFAFFTDRIDSSIQAEAGTLDLQLSTITAAKTSDFKPGEGIAIDFTLSNAGNKSADVLETIVLTSSIAMSDTTEFDLYNATDVTLDSKGKVTAIKSGAQPLTVRSVSADKKQITYAIPEFILNGTGEAAEIETGALGTAKASAYVLVFRTHAGNEFQDTTISLNYEAQAKQHRNTNADTWQVVKTEDINFAGNPIKGVPVNP